MSIRDGWDILPAMISTYPKASEHQHSADLIFRRFGQCLTRLPRRLRDETDDRNRFSTAVEGSLAVNGVIENKDSTAVAAR